MNKHTPGPWSVSELDATGEQSPHYFFVEPGVAVIEKKIAGHDQHDEADARLIAAAPDLLAALQDLFDADMEYHLMGDGKDDQIAAIAKAHAAIAKATGETK